MTTGSAALISLQERTPDLILLDHVLDAGENGLAFLPRLKSAAAHVPVIVVSGTLAIADQLRALSGPNAAHYVIEKPVDLDILEKPSVVAKFSGAIEDAQDGPDSLTGRVGLLLFPDLFKKRRPTS